MAITMMCQKDAPGAVLSPEWSKQAKFDIYLQTTHEGLVLDLGEYNGRDDSDFYAVVWNPEKGATERIEYASTRGWTYPNNAVIDATPETIAAYEGWVKECKAAALRRAAEAEAKEPKVGRKVKVVRGRKITQGTVGEVFWYGADKFSYDRNAMRVGLKLDNGEKVFTAAKNCEVITE